MGGSAFWDSMIIWLTILPILAFGVLAVLTRVAFWVVGKSIGWGRSAMYVLGAFIALQVIALVADTLFF